MKYIIIPLARFLYAIFLYIYEFIAFKLIVFPLVLLWTFSYKKALIVSSDYLFYESEHYKYNISGEYAYVTFWDYITQKNKIIIN